MYESIDPRGRRKRGTGRIIFSASGYALLMDGKLWRSVDEMCMPRVVQSKDALTAIDLYMNFHILLGNWKLTIILSTANYLPN